MIKDINFAQSQIKRINISRKILTFKNKSFTDK